MKSLRTIALVVLIGCGSGVQKYALYSLDQKLNPIKTEDHDLSEDGANESVVLFYDLNGDGKGDVIMVHASSNGEGHSKKPHQIIEDRNFDGRWDIVSWDYTCDGYIDAVRRNPHGPIHLHFDPWQYSIERSTW